MRETVIDVYDKHYDHYLRNAATIMLWDWRAAAEIVAQAKATLLAKRDMIEADAGRYEKDEDHYGVLLGAVGGTVVKTAVDRARALGYSPPLCEIDIKMFYEDPNFSLEPENAAAERAERAELAERIETLPTVLREPMRLWLADEEIPESLGWHVRTGLTLFGRRKVAA